jgi:transcriptional regulator with XRE-family HTH domain
MSKPGNLQRLGNALRERRSALGYSQESFADKIGMHRAYYSAIERGEKNLTLGLLLRVAAGLGVKLAVLMAEASL